MHQKFRLVTVHAKDTLALVPKCLDIPIPKHFGTNLFLHKYVDT